MEFTRWVLLAGTGKEHGLPSKVVDLAKAFGYALAEQGYGLIVGGWPGVDYLAAKSFDEGIKRKKLSLSDYLLQIIADKPPVTFPNGAQYPNFRGGFLITVPTGAREWIEAIKYADAVILLGGEGGTRDTYTYASQEQRPVFPIAGTGGDAEFVFQDAMNIWDLLPYNGFSREEFSQTLSQPVDTPEEIKQVVQETLSLIQAQFKKETESPNQLFVSYAHEDREWLVKLRSALRPLEKKSTLMVWDDWNLQPGDDFKLTIIKQIAKVRVAILLVSDDFLKSDFIKKHELPQLIKLHQEGLIKLFWLKLNGNLWKKARLKKILSINDPDLSLASLPPAQQQEELIRLRMMVEKALKASVT